MAPVRDILGGVYPATTWDDRDWPNATARGWSVMDRLRERQSALRAEAAAARKRVAEGTETMRMMTAASLASDYEDAMRARWRGGPTVLAFLFAHPDAEAIRTLDANGEYFDLRSGTTWDLFFPGYYRATEDRSGARPVGSGYASNWYFQSRGFDAMREHVELSSEQRWQYSGLTDLVLVCAWIGDRGEPTVDWASTISGSVTSKDGPGTLTLSEVIERITRDLKSGAEDPSFGVGEVVDPAAPNSGGTLGRDLMVGTLSGIAASLGKGALGL